MSIVMWMLTGSILGWAAYAYLSLNAERGLAASIIIGACGGFVGGKMIAPMFTAGALAPDEFSSAALIFSAAAAAAFLAAGNLVNKRWGV
jgi:uncharacterized membrane protein YeaQ/YmgE (transglycosylase-associated protein family)